MQESTENKDGGGDKETTTDTTRTSESTTQEQSPGLRVGDSPDGIGKVLVPGDGAETTRETETETSHTETTDTDKE